MNLIYTSKCSLKKGLTTLSHARTISSKGTRLSVYIRSRPIWKFSSLLYNDRHPLNPTFAKIAFFQWKWHPFIPVLGNISLIAQMTACSKSIIISSGNSTICDAKALKDFVYWSDCLFGNNLHINTRNDCVFTCRSEYGVQLRKLVWYCGKRPIHIPVSTAI